MKSEEEKVEVVFCIAAEKKESVLILQMGRILKQLSQAV